VIKTIDDFQWSLAQKRFNRPKSRTCSFGLIATQNQNIVPDRQRRPRAKEELVGIRSWATPPGLKWTFGASSQSAVDIINTLAAHGSAAASKREFHRYLKPGRVIVDELGYLRSTRQRRTCCSQISANATKRCNRWWITTKPSLNKTLVADLQKRTALTSAILDRVSTTPDTVIIEGRSYRTRTRLDE